MGGPSLATGPPNAGIPERPFHQARPHVLEDRELVPARILEELARPRRDLERSAFGQTHGRDLRAELVVVPDERPPEDLHVVLEVPVEVAGADVQVGELAEGSGHRLRDKSTGAMSLAGTGQNLFHLAGSPSAWPRPSNPRISPRTRCSPNRASRRTAGSPRSRYIGPAWTRTST